MERVNEGAFEFIGEFFRLARNGGQLIAKSSSFFDYIPLHITVHHLQYHFLLISLSLCSLRILNKISKLTKQKFVGSMSPLPDLPPSNLGTKEQYDNQSFGTS